MRERENISERWRLTMRRNGIHPFIHRWVQFGNEFLVRWAWKFGETIVRTLDRILRDRSFQFQISIQFQLQQLTSVRMEWARMSINPRKRLKYAIDDDLFVGCWNPSSQYSSSHSRGKSISKLNQVRLKKEREIDKYYLTLLLAGHRNDPRTNKWFVQCWRLP